MILKRIRFNLGLTISTEVGIVAILTLVVTVPLFTNAILSEILQEQLSEKAERNKRSLFSLHAYYLDQSNYSPVTVKGTDAVTAYIRQQFEEQMGLRVEQIVVERITEQLLWRPIETRSTKPPFQYLYLSLLNNNLIPENVTFVEGKIPTMEGFEISSPIPVAVYEQLADENFINVGDIYQSKEFSIEVVGIFRARDPQDRAWFYSPETTFKGSVWVPIEAFKTTLPELLDRPQNITSWYSIVSDESLHFYHSRNYSHQMVRLDAGLKSMAPGMRIDYSPLDMLQAYEQRLRAVTILFFAAGAPILLLALFFTSLTASIAVQQNTTEIVTMRTRGISPGQALRMNLVESLILVGIALPVVLILSWLGAILIGQSRSFLQFGELGSQQPGVVAQSGIVIPPYLSFADINYAWLGLMILIILAARAAPFLSLWRTPVAELKHRLARQTTSQETRPFWQRYYLDFILIVPSIYIYLTYRGILKPGFGNAISQAMADLRVSATNYTLNQAGSDLFARTDLQFNYDPLIFFSAPLFAIACCMISLRLLPLILRLFNNILNRISKPWSYLALQEISRRPHDHTNTLLLIMIALSLSVYSASMGRTLGLWLYQSRAYLNGADLVLREYSLVFASGAGPSNSSPSGYSTSNPPTTNQETAQAMGQPGTEGTPGPLSLISLDRHLELPEIVHTTFVGKYDCRFSFAEASPSTGDKECQILGIDRLTFPEVAFFRPDFLVRSGHAGNIAGSGTTESAPNAPSLGALMNELAALPQSVLVPQRLLDQTGLSIGDTIKLKVSASNLGLNLNEDMVIAGAYHFFPTIYPDEKTTLVVNLEALFGSYEAIVGYNVWVDLLPEATSTNVLKQVQDLAYKDRMGIQVLGNTLASIEEAKSQPEWTGLFGVLNLGFLLTGLMPGIGFILYSFASLRKRTIELGILQAIGLRFQHLVGSVVLEQLLLMSIAIGGGILIGYLSSLLFLPVLQLGIGAGSPVPPFQVEIGWSESGWLSLYFFLVLSITVGSTIIAMARMQIFQAVKMGESIS